MSSNEKISNQEYQGETEQSNNKEKEIYFIKISPQDKNKNFNNLKFKCKIIPHEIYNKNIEISKGKGVLWHSVFKIVRKNYGKEKYENDFVFPFIIGCDSFDIKFSTKGNSFVHETELLKGNKFIDNSIKEKIEQNIIPLYN